MLGSKIVEYKGRLYLVNRTLPGGIPAADDRVDITEQALEAVGALLDGMPGNCRKIPKGRLLLVKGKQA
jgi:hypothetical protein